MDVTREQLLSIIETVGVSADVSMVGGDMKLAAAGIDSLEMMNIFLGIEQQFGIKIPDEDIDSLGTIDDIIEYLKKA